MSISTWYDRKEIPGEKSIGESMTIPNQALTMKEILLRFSRGQSIPGRMNDEWETEDDEDFSEYDKLDRFEKMDLAMQIKEQIQQTQQSLINGSKTAEKPSDVQNPSETEKTSEDV